ncbi:MAG TPA: hypothetical protein VLA19_17225 [Herpetosiphonaceae bacterium]|nr:hypothetical protein [Herpetosiphonaceae bacterium]
MTWTMISYVLQLSEYILSSAFCTELPKHGSSCRYAGRDKPAAFVNMIPGDDPIIGTQPQVRHLEVVAEWRRQPLEMLVQVVPPIADQSALQRR